MKERDVVFLKVLCVTLTLALVAGCSSIRSTVLESNESYGRQGGLLYYLPKKDLRVTITVDNPKNSASKKMTDLGDKIDKVKADLGDKKLDKEQKSVLKDKLKRYKTQFDYFNRLADSIPDYDGVVNMKAESTAAYPDLTNRYAMKYGSNWAGKVKIDVGVSSIGLLSSTTTQSFGDESALSAVESQIEQAKLNDFISLTWPRQCKHIGNYVFILKLEELESGKQVELCQNTFVAVDKSGVTRSGSVLPKLKSSRRHLSKEQLGKGKGNVRKSGIFYRQQIPYQVTMSYTNQPTNVDAKDSALPVSIAKNVKSALIFSPTEAPRNFLPVHRTLFADNEASITFEEGIPVNYKQDSEGEIISFLTVPAEIIKAYFEAVGSVYSGISSRNENEISSLSNGLELELVRRRAEECTDALDKDNDDKFDSLECTSLISD